MDKLAVKEVEIDEARKLSKQTGAKFVWLGGPVRISIPEALEISDTQILAIEPDEILSFGEDKLKLLQHDIFVCYHGITSAAVVKYLKSKKNIDAYSLKGGITAIVGENF